MLAVGLVDDGHVRTAQLLFSRAGFEAARHASRIVSHLSTTSLSHGTAAPAADSDLSARAAKQIWMPGNKRRLPFLSGEGASAFSDRLSLILAVSFLPCLHILVSRDEAHAWRSLRFPPAGDPIFDGYLAQAVMNLEATDDAYLRGRSKQALRTNLHHAEAGGIRAVRLGSYDEWYPVAEEIIGLRDWGRYTLGRMSAPDPSQKIGYFAAVDSEGRAVSEAAVAIFDDAAVLFSLLSRPTQPASAASRYLLHTHMRSELHTEDVRHLLAGSMLRARPGIRYFQRLLGYDVCNIAINIRG